MKFFYSILFSLLLFCTISSTHAENIRMFWITDTITGKTVGPVIAQPDVEFTTDGGTWVIRKSMKGTILFKNKDEAGFYGPYDFEKQRIFDLGDQAVFFSNIEHFTGDDPSTVVPTVTIQEIRRVKEPLPEKDIPQGWVKQELPSTNPRDHLARPEAFSLTQHTAPTQVGIFYEPKHSTKYDWSVGEFAGNSGSEIESKSFGVEATYNNWFAEIAYVSDAETSDTLVPNGTTLSDLSLHNGSGFMATLGYLYAFNIDGNWNASIGGRFRYQSLSFDMTGTALTKNGQHINTTGTLGFDIQNDSNSTNTADNGGYNFVTYNESVSMDAMMLTAMAGIDYTTWYWGLGAFFILDCYTDTEFDGSIEVVDETYDLSADKSDPIGVAIKGWYSPASNVTLTGQFTFGTDTSLRLGLGLVF